MKSMVPAHISLEVLEKARSLMRSRTQSNGAPAWELTELAVAKGKDLATIYQVDSQLVMVALYLAHIVFSSQRDSDIMKHHMTRSAVEAEQWLLEWGVDPATAGHVRRAIALHHSPADSGDKYCEVVKNAECFKFLSPEGLRIFIADLKARGLSDAEIRDYARYKVEQKEGYLSLAVPQREATAVKSQLLSLINDLV